MEVFIQIHANVAAEGWSAVQGEPGSSVGEETSPPGRECTPRVGGGSSKKVRDSQRTRTNDLAEMASASPQDRG